MPKHFVAAAMFASLLAGADAALVLDRILPDGAPTGVFGALIAFTGFVLAQRAADRAEG